MLAIKTCLLLSLAGLLAACGDTGSPAPTPAPIAEADSAPTTAAVEPEPATPTPTAAPTASPATPTPPPAEAPGIDVDAAVAGGTLVQLIAPLDEPEFYCVDVPGFGASLNLRAGLMAHTCKPGADDEIFAVNQPLPGNLSMPAYDLCVEADGTELVLRACSDSAMQRFALDGEGALSLAGTALCAAVAPGEGEPTGGPSHVRRDLLLLDCGEGDSALRRWSLPGPSPR